MKGKFAGLTPSKAPINEPKPVDFNSTSSEHGKQKGPCTLSEDKYSCIPKPNPQSPCWYPLSWENGYPRTFSISELEMITNGFADENIVSEKERNIYEGICKGKPVLVIQFAGNDDRFWSLLKILSRVRHRNILNLVGYCCTDASLYMLCD